MNLSQTQFARTVGASPRSVNRWENHGFCPTRLSLYRLRELQHMMDNLDLRDRTIDRRYFALDFSPNGEGGRFGAPGAPRRG